MVNMDKHLVDAFLKLVLALSPENLSCDGELSRAQVKAKVRSIRSQWRKLEKIVGHKVSADDICDIVDRRD